MRKIYVNCYVCGLAFEFTDTEDNSHAAAEIVEVHYRETKHTPIRLASTPPSDGREHEDHNWLK